MGTLITATKAPSCAGAFAVRGTAVAVAGMPTAVVGGAMAHTAAPVEGTGLPVGAVLRLRPLGTEAGLRGYAADAAYVLAFTGTDVQLNSDTPGDLPPRDPLS